MLKIEHLTKVYGGKKAVDDLSLHIQPGEIYGFIGHNGAGKTTTLKSVVGILQFDEGEITIDGISIREQPLACKKKFAYIPDNPDLYDFMTGIKYLNFIADVFGVDENIRQERIRKYAELFELTNDLGQPIAAYSHGMKQKLALCCALIHAPRVLFLDEPTTGVDPVSRREFWTMLKKLRDEHGLTVLVSTPYMDEASWCDRISLMQGGRFMQTDTPVGIVEAYADRLFAVMAADMHGLMTGLKACPLVGTSFSFGAAYHVTLVPGATPDALRSWLTAKGYAEVGITEISPSVEDCFMALMKTSEK